MQLHMKQARFGPCRGQAVGRKPVLIGVAFGIVWTWLSRKGLTFDHVYRVIRARDGLRSPTERALTCGCDFPIDINSRRPQSSYRHIPTPPFPFIGRGRNTLHPDFHRKRPLLPWASTMGRAWTMTRTFIPSRLDKENKKFVAANPPRYQPLRRVRSCRHSRKVGAKDSYYVRTDKHRSHRSAT